MYGRRNSAPATTIVQRRNEQPTVRYSLLRSIFGEMTALLESRFTLYMRRREETTMIIAHTARPMALMSGSPRSSIMTSSDPISSMADTPPRRVGSFSGSLSASLGMWPDANITMIRQMGTLMKNSHPQCICSVITPPSTGPSISARPEDAPMTDMPSPFLSAGSMCTTMDGRTELIMAADIPWTNLKAMSIQKLCDTPHTNDDMPNSAVPRIMNLFTRPFLANLPSGSSIAANPTT